MTREEFELKRQLDTYFREQTELQTKIAEHLVSIERQQRAMLAIFAAVTQKDQG
jgi:hypothetical protein